MPGRNKRDLVQKMIAAQGELRSYLILHKAKGYMSERDNSALREALFRLCGELREQFPLVRTRLTDEEVVAFQDGTGALTTAALCLMRTRCDCPSFVAVDTDKLERQLRIVQQATVCLNRQQAALDA